MSQNIVIIGAVALGPKAACRLKRLKPDSNVIMIDKDNLISYGGCGIPYFIAGDISDSEQLQATTFHMLRDVKFFKEIKDVQAITNTEVLAIDREAKTVLVQSLIDQKQQQIPYDKLVLGMGSTPRVLPIEGNQLDGIFTVSDLNKAITIKEELVAGKINKAVVIGAGAIGLEMAEALADLWEIETSVVEIMDQILPGIISPQMARMAQHHMEENGLSFYMGEKVERFEGESRVSKVITNNRTLEAELVIMAAGVTPNSKLAKDANLEVSPKGGIIVNKQMQTSDPDIYAGGDCVEIPNIITGKSGYYPLGSLANREGRVIGSNLAGNKQEFEGAIGSFVIKLFEISVANAGLSLKTALKEGFDAVSAFVVQFDRAHFLPDRNLMFLELVVEKGSGRVLGIHGLGDAGHAMVARVNAVAGILKYKPTTMDISNLELPYAPPFSSAMDILNTLGNVAENILAGKNKVIDIETFVEYWKKRETNESIFIDCRESGNAEPFVNSYPKHWKNIPQGQLRDRLSEVPQDKRIILICNTGSRSYEAQVILDHAGFRDIQNIQGGIAAIEKWGMNI